MTDPADDENTTEGSHVSTGVKYILAAGAVATALGAILALGQALWPDSEKPAPRLSATISALQVDPKVPLVDYLEDVPQARTSRRKARVQGTIFASARLAQSSPSTVVPAPPPPEPESPPATTSPQTTTTTTTPQPPPDVPSSPPESPGPSTRNQLPPLPSATTALLELVEEKPLDDVIELPTGGFKIKTQYVTDILTDDGNAPGDEVRRVLTSTRLQIANPKGPEPTWILH